MAAPSASGAYRETLEGLRTLLANSATFRTLVGAADVAAALVIIGRDVIDATGAEIALPRIRAFLPEYRRDEIGHGNWRASGVGEVVIEVAPSGSYPTDSDAEAWFANQLGGIVDDLTSLVTTGPYLTASSFSTDGKSMRNARGETAYWRCVLRCEFGNRGAA